MGAMCAICKTYQPIKRNLTVDQKPARKAADVLGHELGCGHLFGNKEFMEIQKRVNGIRKIYSEHLVELEKEYQKQLAGAMEGIKSMKGAD